MNKIQMLFESKKGYRDVIRRKAIERLSCESYKLIKKIGSGSFGTVVALQTSRNEKVAAKIVPQNIISNGEFTEWHKFDHPNVVPVLNIIREPNFNVFLMPLHEMSLALLLKQKQFWENPRSFDQTISWLEDVLKGLHYLHSLDICHLDLEEDNVMITSEMHAALGDFTYVTKITERVRRYGVKPYSRPPEAGNRNGHCPEVDGASFDIWAFGMLCLKLWTRELPWNKSDNRDCWKRNVYALLFKLLQFSTFSKLINNTFPKGTLDESKLYLALNLVQGILRYKPDDRPSTTCILLHPLMSENFEEEVLLQTDFMWITFITASGIFQESPSPEAKYKNWNAGDFITPVTVDECREGTQLKSKVLEESVNVSDVITCVHTCFQDVDTHAKEEDAFLLNNFRTAYENVHTCM